MSKELLYWMRDAANSICGQTGARTHQEKLLEAADRLERLEAVAKAARAIVDGPPGPGVSKQEQEDWDTAFHVQLAEQLALLPRI